MPEPIAATIRHRAVGTASDTGASALRIGMILAISVAIMTTSDGAHRYVASSRGSLGGTLCFRHAQRSDGMNDRRGIGAK